MPAQKGGTSKTRALPPLTSEAPQSSGRLMAARRKGVPSRLVPEFGALAIGGDLARRLHRPCHERSSVAQSHFEAAIAIPLPFHDRAGAVEFVGQAEHRPRHDPPERTKTMSHAPSANCTGSRSARDNAKRGCGPAKKPRTPRPQTWRIRGRHRPSIGFGPLGWHGNSR